MYALYVYIICMYVCMYMYIHIYIYICMYMYVCVCAYIYTCNTYVCMRACMYVCMYVCVYSYLCAYMYIQVYRRRIHPHLERETQKDRVRDQLATTVTFQSNICIRAMCVFMRARACSHANTHACKFILTRQSTHAKHRILNTEGYRNRQRQGLGIKQNNIS